MFGIFRDTKEASVSPVVRVRVREVESEFEGTANVKPCRAIVKASGFILSVMKSRWRVENRRVM